MQDAEKDLWALKTCRKKMCLLRNRKIFFCCPQLGEQDSLTWVIHIGTVFLTLIAKRTEVPILQIKRLSHIFTLSRKRISRVKITFFDLKFWQSPCDLLMPGFLDSIWSSANWEPSAAYLSEKWLLMWPPESHGLQDLLILLGNNSVGHTFYFSIQGY